MTTLSNATKSNKEQQESNYGLKTYDKFCNDVQADLVARNGLNDANWNGEGHGCEPL
jgi:hypothetical protein